MISFKALITSQTHWLFRVQTESLSNKKRISPRWVQTEQQGPEQI